MKASGSLAVGKSTSVLASIKAPRRLSPRQSKAILLVCTLCAGAVTPPSFAQNAAPRGAARPTDPPPNYCDLGEVQLESGETIKNVRMSYITYGALNASKSNAILSIHGLRGTRNSQTSWAGRGKAFDTERYFVIQPDTLGATSLDSSATTSPTRSGLNMAFPQFGIRDMVAVEHMMLTKCLSLNHLVAVTGTSMGGMETLQWAVSFPDFMDAAIPMVPQARTSLQARAIWELARRAIALDPKWRDGAYPADDPPRTGVVIGVGIQTLFSSSSAALQDRPAPVPGPATAAGAGSEAGPPGGGVDGRDWYYRTIAIQRHNIADTPPFNGDLGAAAKSIKARLLVFSNCRDQLLVPVEGGVIEVVKNAPVARVIDVNDPEGHGGTTTPESETLITTEVHDLLGRIENGKSGIRGPRFESGRKLEFYCSR